MRIKCCLLLSLVIVAFLPLKIFAQTAVDTSNKQLSLKQCVDFALKNQPAVRQAAIDEAINEKDIGISLSAWLPQVTGSGLYDYYFKGSPVFTTPGGVAPSGGNANNLSTLGLQANQVIYNNDVLQA